MPDLIYTTTGTELSSVADAIRSATGGSADLEYPDGFISGINSITKTSYAGTFTSPAAGETQIITIPYTGTGYPRSLTLFLDSGAASPSSNCTYFVSYAKINNTAPDYTSSNNNNKVNGIRYYYNNTGTGTVYLEGTKAYTSSGNVSDTPFFRSNTSFEIKSAPSGSNAGLKHWTKYYYVVGY